MSIEITPFAPEMVNEVRAFNQRLKAGGLSYQFPERHEPAIPKLNGEKIFQEYFLAIEGGQTVRGTFILQHQVFSSWGKAINVAHYDLPISEGFLDKAYSLTGVQLVMNALKRQPLLFSLGLGGHDEPLAQMLKRLGWPVIEVPFYFKVHHPVAFLRNIQALRRTRFRRAALDFLAATGGGWAGIKAMHYLKQERGGATSLEIKTVAEFGTWADEIWDRCKNEYALCGIRDSETLNILYASQKRDFIRLKITSRGKIFGWAVLLNTQMNGSPQFGDMRVGTIVDCLAKRENAAHVIRAAADHLEKLGIDMALSNQMDAAWGDALARCGFVEGPSNYLFAVSKKLSELLHPLEHNRGKIHLTRGDGGGPMNL